MRLKWKEWETPTWKTPWPFVILFRWSKNRFHSNSISVFLFFLFLWLNWTCPFKGARGQRAMGRVESGAHLGRVSRPAGLESRAQFQYDRRIWTQRRRHPLQAIGGNQSGHWQFLVFAHRLWWPISRCVIQFGLLRPEMMDSFWYVTSCISCRWNDGCDSNVPFWTSHATPKGNLHSSLDGSHWSGHTGFPGLDWWHPDRCYSSSTPLQRWTGLPSRNRPRNRLFPQRSRKYSLRPRIKYSLFSLKTTFSAGPIQIRIYGKVGHHFEENYFFSDGTSSSLDLFI